MADPLIREPDPVRPRPRAGDADAALVRSGWVWGLLRLGLGWIFLWSFLDKFFGLGFSTCRVTEATATDPMQVGTIDYLCEASAVKGSSVIYEFLTFGTVDSKTGDWFSWMAPDSPTTQNVWDVVFMIALLGAGVTLLFGIAVRIGAIGAALLSVSMYLAGFVWPAQNPFVDELLIYAFVLVGVAVADAGRFVGYGRRWQTIPVVRDHSFLH